VAFPSVDEAVAWLESHVDFERVAPNRREIPTLQPIRDTLSALGEPHHDYPSVHVTGTNGKGTTTTLVSALLTTSGLRVGTFTSPDLHSINERIAVAGIPIDDDTMCSLLGRLFDAERVTSIVLTRFEILTIAALLHFSDEGVDVAVVEVGLGGTWDSTNVIDADVSVLTNVDLDHVAVLGPTVADIARDKVGIFRPGGIAVLGTEDGTVVGIATERCEAIGSTLLRSGQDFHLVRNDVALGGRLLSVTTQFASYEEIVLSLHGIHQGDNATTALVAAEAFVGRALGEQVVRATFHAATMPGRLELLSRRPTIVVDGAHNPAGVRALAAAIDGAFYVDGVRRCVLGMLTGRDVNDMVAPLVDAGVSEFYCCAPTSPRAMAASLVVDAVRARGGTAYECPSVASALAHAREHSNDDDLILAVGSLYLVGEVRAIVLHLDTRHAS
jgi:dihydrofolate synthase / folylpolyglutamate synthase